jgi:hypothetical protein
VLSSARALGDRDRRWAEVMRRGWSRGDGGHRRRIAARRRPTADRRAAFDRRGAARPATRPPTPITVAAARQQHGGQQTQPQANLAYWHLRLSSNGGGARQPERPAGAEGKDTDPDPEPPGTGPGLQRSGGLTIRVCWVGRRLPERAVVLVLLRRPRGCVLCPGNRGLLPQSMRGVWPQARKTRMRARSQCPRTTDCTARLGCKGWRAGGVSPQRRTGRSLRRLTPPARQPL